jgi:hypothetical protein
MVVYIPYEACVQARYSIVLTQSACARNARTLRYRSALETAMWFLLYLRIWKPLISRMHIARMWWSTFEPFHCLPSVDDLHPWDRCVQIWYCP